ncbi:cytochrome c maturation protein CcmE [Alkalicaulis satelles]|uniref:Cytochrome c-type biogenesis protein CcmE n=1 Tax=Alkalicaulis satelles TaxID=2609175 RepID=A0A5M6ZK20_9PROT|nr:cytochrome c maturation protein CcmE [Alkalicaulis satelles]KAA5805166.1 cytochrome c maturation protein CcmE [Alkalicaulis satelles]
MRQARKRLWIIAAGAAVLVAAAALAFTAMRDAMVFFYSPAMVAENPPLPGQRVRVGGLVVTGSVERPSAGGAHFTVTDGRADIRIEFAGSLPDLFREGQGIVAEGAFDEQARFTAQTVLAKHDETYMPPEVARALRESGYWNDGPPSAGQYVGPASGASR